MFIILVFFIQTAKECGIRVKGVGRKISEGRGNGKKYPKLTKKYRKIALFSLFQGGPTEKRQKNGTFKISTIFVPPMIRVYEPEFSDEFKSWIKIYRTYPQQEYNRLKAGLFL